MAKISPINKKLKSQVLEHDFLGSQDDRPEDRTPSSRDMTRGELSQQIQAFLASGGEIHEVASGVCNDPPRRPKTSYGSQPI